MKYIYNDALDSIALDQLAQLEESEGISLDEPTYVRTELDERDLEIVIDCLEAGMESYESDSEDDEEAKDAVKRLMDIINLLRA